MYNGRGHSLLGISLLGYNTGCNIGKFRKVYVVTDKEKKKYIDCDPYEADESEIIMRKVKVVKTRIEHPCFLGDHIIEPGSMARYETAMVDGEFGRFYDCCKCLDKHIEEYG